ncbi:hypothetical protein Poly30_26740 [Planctomycetes bacterium Poly30]|uniref:Glycosyltransferase RgtA/B/C/D-like domain-containing protein n=1 Tax=Saltatorellus ferox TaxID=2528018 RepID=A0A518ESW5_9BACT|nr:hypothetical protein Poly30_26740 [Planctomycetes bacterium Poly30]
MPRATRAARAWTFAAYLALATLVHFAVGAYQSGFGGFEDEPAHLVTALMIRDWIVAGFHDPYAWLDPRGFAETYYIHYPKVAIGQWPPVLHAMLAVWMLVFGASKVAIVSLLTIVTAVLASLVCELVRRPLGLWAGTVAGMMFLTVPIVQLCSGAAMTELPVALFSFLAVLFFGRFLETGRARWVWSFAGAAAATVLTKGTGLALALVPALAIAFSGRWEVLKRPSLWAAGALVGLLTAPWYLVTVSMTQDSWGGGSSPSWAYAKFAATSYAGWSWDLAGVLGLCLVPVGTWWGLRECRRRRPESDRWAALAAWALALAALHHVVPSSVEERHLSVLAPVWIVFAALGAGHAALGLARRWQRQGLAQGEPTGEGAVAGLGVAVLAVSALLWNGAPPVKDFRGWDIAGAEWVERLPEGPTRMLIASDPVGEGLFVAGAALADEVRRGGADPRALVIRASKALCHAGWSGRSYVPLFSEQRALEDWLESKGVGLIAIDESVRETRHWYPHMDQLLTAIHADGSPWVEVERWDVVRNAAHEPAALVGYLRQGWRDLPLPDLRLEEIRAVALDAADH